MTPQKTDVLVIGGGPAGTTFATLMAKKGWAVTLLEKDTHPRFHIGESLLPMNLPIFERLDVLDEIRQMGVVKRGADFTLGNSGVAHQTFRFDMALGNSPGYSFEVRRSDFDALLFSRCRESGVDARQRVRVSAVGENVNNHRLVEAVGPSGEKLSWRARYVVDASGRDTFLASNKGWKKRNPKHATAAIFGHFRGVARRPDADAGNISVYWFNQGWVWMIPLPNDIMSIGMVCYPQHMKTRQGSLDEFLWQTLEGIDEARERLAAAEPVVKAQATGNYSYAARAAIGPGFVLIGDAFAFIDPVFSSGVFLAMSSAERAIALAEAWLRGEKLRYRIECSTYKRHLRQGLSTFSWFIYRFTSPVMCDLLSNPRNVFQVAQAVMSMLAGDVHSRTTIRWRLLVFKVIYYSSCLGHWRGMRTWLKQRQDGVGLGPA